MSAWLEQHLLCGDKKADGGQRGSPGDSKARLADQAQGLLGRAARAARQAIRGQGHQAVHAFPLCRGKGSASRGQRLNLLRPDIKEGLGMSHSH